MEEFKECADISLDSRYKHRRTIIHIDLDCFYAQVEMLKNPELSTKPVGIKQQHYVITSNYVAREYGIKKCMLITEALALCPKLIIINGEDLHDYRVMSSKVTDIMKQFSAKVEKLGLDENFVDVSDLVQVKISSRNDMNMVLGHTYINEIENNCICGCRERLTVGSYIADEIRNKVKEVLGLTCCAGVAYNKLLAKLVCSTHKPNQQTTVFPSAAIDLVSNLSHVRAIPGIGRKTSDMLDALGVSTISDLQNCSLEQLERHFGKSIAVWIKSASFGVDDSEVKESGKQQVIGLEEAAKVISTIEDVQKRICSLVERGLLLIEEDGRYPTTLRVTVRKYSSSEDYLRQRESKQCSISPSVFKMSSAKVQICETALGLFKKLVDHTKPFHLTLVGLAFTKFQEEIPANSSLLRFLETKETGNVIKPVTKSLGSSKCESTEKEENITQFKDRGTHITQCNIEKIDKSVFDQLPPDIKAEILQTYSLNGNDPCTSNSASTSAAQCPPGVDLKVFNELPHEIQMELIRESQNNNSPRTVNGSKPTKKQKSILNYISKK